MTTTDSPTRAPETPLAPRLFKASASTVFALGMLIHLGRMIVGLEPWQRNVFTPPVDIAFGALIIFPAVTGLISWRLYAGGPGLRLVYAFAMVLLIISVPLHLRTALTWSTEYLNAFPLWYSAIEVPMFAALSYAMTRLKFAARPKVRVA